MRQDKPLEVCLFEPGGFLGGNNASGVALSPRTAGERCQRWRVSGLQPRRSAVIRRPRLLRVRCSGDLGDHLLARPD